jgi:hypothetical protein
MQNDIAMADDGNVPAAAVRKIVDYFDEERLIAEWLDTMSESRTTTLARASREPASATPDQCRWTMRKEKVSW